MWFLVVFFVCKSKMLMIYDHVFCIYMVPVNYDQKNYDNFQMQLLLSSPQFSSAQLSIQNTKNWQEICNTQHYHNAVRCLYLGSHTDETIITLGSTLITYNTSQFHSAVRTLPDPQFSIASQTFLMLRIIGQKSCISREKEI